MQKAEAKFLQQFWSALQGLPERLEGVTFTGDFQGLSSRYSVAPFASAAVATATLSVAELSSHDSVTIDRAHASASYLCDQLAKPLDWSYDQDPEDISGNYPTADGWLRIHAMYATHRAAACLVLGCPPNRIAVAEKIAQGKSLTLETAIVNAGGCAAEMRTEEAWSQHPQGQAVAAEPLFAFEGHYPSPRPFFLRRRSLTARPLEGLRVLDLTRVLAGPIGARFLAAYGAEVMRIDPIGFFESNALLVETTRGKRTAGLNLKDDGDLAHFHKLLRDCDVLIHGYRPGAMERMGLGLSEMLTLNPALVVVRHNAYGWSGPWKDRRGFDSLVQMSCGIAQAPTKPSPLPAQALDYTTGYLIAAAVCHGLRASHQQTKLSLARVAHELMQAEKAGPTSLPSFSHLESRFTTQATDWGKTQQLSCPGRIGSIEPYWVLQAGIISKSHRIEWQPTSRVREGFFQK